MNPVPPTVDDNALPSTAKPTRPAEMGKRNRSKRGPPPPKPGNKAVASASVPAATATDLADDFEQYDSGADGSVKSGGVPSSDGESSEDELALAAREEAGNDSDVEVTFDFYDPVPGDIAAVQGFLLDLCAASGLSARTVAEAVVAQTRVGTVVKLEYDAQPIGFISALCIEAHRDALGPLGRTLRRVCGVTEEEDKAGAVDGDTKSDGKGDAMNDGKSTANGGAAACAIGAQTPAERARFYNVLRHSFSTDASSRGARVGLLLTDRVVNLPPQLVPKMQEALFLEVGWAQEDEPTEALRDMYNFHWFLYVTDAYVGAAAPAGASKQSKPAKKKSRVAGAQAEAANAPGPGEVAFARVEDEIYLSAATHSVAWNAPAPEAGPGGVRRVKIAMLVKKARMEAAVKETAKVFGVAAEAETEGIN